MYSKGLIASVCVCACVCVYLLQDLATRCNANENQIGIKENMIEFGQSK